MLPYSYNRLLNSSTRIKVGPGKNSKKADFSIIRKQICHKITYPKSSKIHFTEKFLWPIKYLGLCDYIVWRKQIFHTYLIYQPLPTHNFRLENGIDFKSDQW